MSQRSQIAAQLTAPNQGTRLQAVSFLQAVSLRQGAPQLCLTLGRTSRSLLGLAPALSERGGRVIPAETWPGDPLLFS